jgi:hypothetical protein
VKWDFVHKVFEIALPLVRNFALEKNFRRVGSRHDFAPIEVVQSTRRKQAIGS